MKIVAPLLTETAIPAAFLCFSVSVFQITAGISIVITKKYTQVKLVVDVFYYNILESDSKRAFPAVHDVFEFGGVEN